MSSSSVVACVVCYQSVTVLSWQLVTVTDHSYFLLVSLTNHIHVVMAMLVLVTNHIPVVMAMLVLLTNHIHVVMAMCSVPHHGITHLLTTLDLC